MSNRDLPSSLPWCDETIEWWKHLNESGRADALSDFEWDNLKLIAILHHQIWSVGDLKLIPRFYRCLERLDLLDL